MRSGPATKVRPLRVAAPCRCSKSLRRALGAPAMRQHRRHEAFTGHEMHALIAQLSTAIYIAVMSDHRADLVVLHEHPEWQKPLFAALGERAVPFEAFDVTRAAFTN